MLESLTALSLTGTALVLAGSHALAWRAGRAQRREAAPRASEPAPPPLPVLVVDNCHPAQDALRTLDADFAAVPTYVETLVRQIEGVKSDTESGIALVIDEVNGINRQAREQVGRMHASLDGSEALARSSERPRAIIASLQSTLDERIAQIQANFDSLQVLAQDFDTLRPIIESISAIADKAFFLSINAAVEAARAGPAGAAFGLVANEMRALSKMTQTASKEIGAGIATFTGRMQGEIDRARPSVENTGDELDRLVAELGELQTGFAQAGQALSTTIQSMDGEHREMVNRLSTILGHVQFQDIIRQRLDQVSEALCELGEHVRASTASACLGETGMLPSLHERLLGQQKRYVMQSQRTAFAAAGGAALAKTDDAPSIELF